MVWFQLDLNPLGPKSTIPIVIGQIYTLSVDNGYSTSHFGILGHHNQHLDSSTRDEEPLVNGAVNGSRGQVLAARDSGQLSLVGVVGRVLDLGVGTDGC